MNISAKCSSRQPHVVLPVKLRCPVRKLTCVSRQTCLNKSGKRHSKHPMETGTAIKTAAARPVCVMPAFFLMLGPETVSSMCWIRVDPSRLLPPWFARAGRLLPWSPTLHVICMLTTWPWKRCGFSEAVCAGVGSWMAGLVPRSPQEPSRERESPRISSVTSPPERKHPLFRSNAVVSSKYHVFKWRTLCKILNQSAGCMMTVWMPLMSSS